MCFFLCLGFQSPTHAPTHAHTIMQQSSYFIFFSIPMILSQTCNTLTFSEITKSKHIRMQSGMNSAHCSALQMHTSVPFCASISLQAPFNHCFAIVGFYYGNCYGTFNALTLLNYFNFSFSYNKTEHVDTK